MAVLVEAISVIVRCDAIMSRYRGGWEAFGDAIPNATLCTDGELARVGFTSPADTERFVRNLEQQGLRFLGDGAAIDVAVVDQQRGPTTTCDWLEFGKLTYGEDGQVSACWLFEGPRVAAGLHIRGRSLELAMPTGWTFETSLSRHFGFIPSSNQ